MICPPTQHFKFRLLALSLKEKLFLFKNFVSFVSFSLSLSPFCSSLLFSPLCLSLLFVSLFLFLCLTSSYFPSLSPLCFSFPLTPPIPFSLLSVSLFPSLSRLCFSLPLFLLYLSLSLISPEIFWLQCTFVKIFCLTFFLSKCLSIYHNVCFPVFLSLGKSQYVCLGNT